jgi:sugar lactone lactonase YvrE
MLDPQGTSRVVADGFQSVFDIVAGADGTLFVADNVRGDLVRINPDGSRQVLASNLLTADPIHLALSADGRLYLNSIITRLVEVDPTTGNLRTIEGLYTPCTANPADFFVSDTGDLIFIDPQRNQVLQFDPRRGKLEILVPDAGLNSPAAAIGPDQDLYLGLGSCDPNIPARIVRIDEAGQQHTYFDQLDGYIQAIAFAPDGGLYIAQHPVTPGPGQLLYLPWQAERAQPIPGIATPFLLSMAVNPQSGNLFISRLEGAAVEEVSAGGLVARHPITLPKPAHDFYITFNPEGELFAYLSEGERNATGPVVDRWILRLDWEEGTSQLVLEFPRQGCCPMGNLTADSHGNLWWLVNPDARLMRISPDGTSEIFARNLPIDSAAVAVNDQGVIYITSPAGIYRFSP